MSRTDPHRPPAQPDIAASAILSWRKATLDEMLQITLAVTIPVVVLDTVTSLQRGDLGWVLFSVTMIGALLYAATLRRQFQLRAYVMLAIALMYTAMTLLNLGLVGAGRLIAIFAVFMAAMLLPHRHAIALTALICLSSSAIVIGQASGLLALPPEAVARAGEPQTILINLIVMLIFIITMVRMILSLVEKLSSTLKQAGAALAERDALNSRLEDLVAERTASLARQLSLQRGLAGCSRVLLSRSSVTSEKYRATLNEALGIVLEAVGGDRISVAQYPSYEQGVEKFFREFRSLADVQRVDVRQKRPMNAEELADMPDALNVWKTGGAFNGPVAGRFPEHQLYARYLSDNGTKAVFIQSIQVGGRPWGHILVIDYTHERSWDEAAVQAIQTAAEMIVTFAEGWCMARSLREREELLSSINDALPDGYLHQLIQRQDGTYEGFTYVSRGVERLMGLTPAQILADPYALRHTVLAEDLAQLEAADSEAVRAVAIFDIEVRQRKADGSIGWFHTRSVPQSILGKDQILWNGISVEITPRKEAELALAAREAQLRALGDNFPNGFIYQYRFDRQQRRTFTYLSSGVERIWGVTAAAGLADAATIFSTLVAEDRARMCAAELRVRAGT